MRDDDDLDEETTKRTKKPRTNETSPSSTPSNSREDCCSPLWQLVTDLPLLFSEKILDKKLDKTSVKLFFETNRAARALVKNYSPQVYQTHVRGEMVNNNSKDSSSSNNNNNKKKKMGIKSLCFSRETLKYCFERYAWGFENNVFKFYPGRGSGRFARIVASMNKLELLKYAREEAKCDWDKDVLIEAARAARELRDDEILHRKSVPVGKRRHVFRGFEIRVSSERREAVAVFEIFTGDGASAVV